jgi:hypothetical protein
MLHTDDSRIPFKTQQIKILINDHLVHNMKRELGVSKYTFNENTSTEINRESSVIRVDTRGVLVERQRGQSRNYLKTDTAGSYEMLVSDYMVP